MDLYVERQCVQQIKQGNLRQFLLLFDGYFDDLYRYVARRVDDSEEREKIVRLTFLDALGQVQNTPLDASYLIWLYGLARPRVWNYLGRVSFPEKQGLIDKAGVPQVDNEDVFVRFGKMMGKLSLEEREILRLKFFEEVADGDLITILAFDEGTVGTKIYRVLKRAHFLLFGESDEQQGVYFGELGGFLQKIREAESIEIPEVLKLSLRADIAGRIDHRDFAVEGEVVEPEFVPPDFVPPVEAVGVAESVGAQPFAVKGEDAVDSPPAPVFEEKPRGSDDPAKIFVEAVREMKQEEEIERLREQREIEKREKLLDFFDRFKHLLTIVPLLAIFIVAGIYLFKYLDFGSLFNVERGYPTACEIDVDFDGDFSDAEMRSVVAGVSDRLCGHFEVKELKIGKNDNGSLEVEVDVPNWFLEYKFVQKIKEWRIKKYVRTANRDQQQG